MELASEEVEEARCGMLNRGIAAPVTKQRVRVSARQGVKTKARVCVWVEGHDMRYDIDSCYGTSMETPQPHTAIYTGLFHCLQSTDSERMAIEHGTMTRWSGRIRSGMGETADDPNRSNNRNFLRDFAIYQSNLLIKKIVWFSIVNQL